MIPRRSPSSPRPALRSRLRRWTLALFCVGALAACAESPTDRLNAARLAVERNDFDTYRTFFTERSASLLRSLEDTATRTRYRYVPNLLRMLPEGEVTEVFEKDNFALLTVENRGQKYEIRMLNENGQWVIDLLALQQFWASIER